MHQFTPKNNICEKGNNWHQHITKVNMFSTDKFTAAEGFYTG